MRSSTARLVVFSWVLVGGCSSSKDASNAPPPSPSDLRVDASPATRGELGVSSWIVTRGASRLFVRGLRNDGGDARVGLDADWSSTADAFRSKHHLQRGDDAADVTVAIARTSPGEASLDVEGELPDSVRRAYTLLAADLAAGPTPPSGGPTPLLQQGVRPLDSQQLLQCKNEMVTKCPTALTCGQTLNRCAGTGPVGVLVNCPSGVSPGSLILFAGGDSLIDIITGHTPDPMRDCVNAIQQLGACNQVEPQCNPVDMKTCADGVKDQCSRDCTNVLNQPCNAGPGTPTCDSLVAKEQQCKSDCLACAGGP